MASTLNAYGTGSMKSLKLANDIVMVGATDDTKSITLKLSGDPSQAGNVDISIPVVTANQTLLHNGSDLDAAKMTGIQSLAQPTFADADILLFADSDDSNNPKGLTGSALKTYVGSLPTGTTDGDLVVYDQTAGQWQRQAMSGDATISNTGALTIANGAVETAMFAAGAVDTAALAPDAVTEAKLADNAVVNASVSASAAIAGSKISPDFGAQLVQTTGSSQVGAAEVFRFGADSDGNWRMCVVSGEFVVQLKSAGSWVTKFTVSA